MNLRRMRGIIREAEREVQNEGRSMESRIAYLGLEIAARKVLAAALTDEARRMPALGRKGNER